MKKRILFIDGPLGGGGAERVLIDLLNNIDYNLYEVDLAVICRSGVLMDEVPDKVNVIELWRGYSWSYKLAYRLSKLLHCNYLFSRKINGKKLRRDYDAEISFLEGMPHKLGALRTTGAKKITWVHADLDTTRYEANLFYPGEELAAYEKMDVIVNVSKDCEAAFIRRFPDCTTRKLVIYNPIDRSKINRMAADYSVPKPKDLLTVITVGRLVSQKNPELLLEVAAKARDAGLPVRFKWVGDGELRSRVENLRDRMGLSDMVEFSGFCKNPFPHIKAADVMMVTSVVEGFCLVICEAMCLGVPVISTKTAGPSEIIDNNKYGVLTDKSADALYNALLALLNNPEKCVSIAQCASSRPDFYSVETAVQNLYSLI